MFSFHFYEKHAAFPIMLKNTQKLNPLRESKSWANSEMTLTRFCGVCERGNSIQLLLIGDSAKRKTRTGPFPRCAASVP